MALRTKEVILEVLLSPVVKVLGLPTALPLRKESKNQKGPPSSLTGLGWVSKLWHSKGLSPHLPSWW